MAINQNISTLPAAPSRSDSPSDFSNKADAFLAALPTLQTELNTYAGEANSTETAIDTSETNAATSETNAEDWASKITGLVLTTDYSAKAYAVSTSLVPDGSSKEWSLKTDGSVDTTEYSSKAYALGGTGVTDVTGAAKEWAVKTGATVDGSEYSAKDYASSQNLISTGSSKDWAIKTGSTVDGTEFSAKKYASDAEASASAAAATAGAESWSAGVTYDTNGSAIGSDGNTYRSLVDGNLGNDPVTDSGTNWINLTATISEEEIKEIFPDILKPDILSPFYGETGVSEAPTIKTGGYYSLFGIEQASAQFQIATDSGFTNIIYDSGVLGAVTEHKVPAGNLVGSTTHYVRVEFKDTSNNTSGFSDTSEFETTTFADLSDPNNIGIAVLGGFLAGNVVSDVDGQTYAIIVSDGDGDTRLTGSGNKEWRTTQTALTEAQTLADGKSVMDHIVANETLSNFPAFEWIKTTLNDANYNGYSDWYLPARDELELIYRHFKPTTEDNLTQARESSSAFGADGATMGTNNSSDPNGAGYTLSDPSQTSITSFQESNSDELRYTYFSATELDAFQAWRQDFEAGFQFTEDKNIGANVRAVRRVAL